MMQRLDSAGERLLGSLRHMQERLERVERQVASGKKLVSASDSPDEVSHLLLARANLSRIDQAQSNLNLIKTEVDAAERTLDGAVKLFDRVRTLGTQGASGMASAESRRTIAGELKIVLERMVGLANTEVMGRFIFSGNNDQAAAYTLDFQQTPPWSPYQGTTATRQATHPTGVPFAIALSGQEIFDNSDPARNVFQGIENLRLALEANDDDAVRQAIAPLERLGRHLNEMLSYYGNAQSQMTDAIDSAAKMKTEFQRQIAGAEEADMVASIVELQQLKIQQEAAMQVRGSMPRTSLFDFLR